jgi:hypothetical protein
MPAIKGNQGKGSDLPIRRESVRVFGDLTGAVDY